MTTALSVNLSGSSSKLNLRRAQGSDSKIANECSLVQKKFSIFRDYKGNSPLHLAAQGGFTNTMKILLNVHSSLLKAQNNDLVGY